MYNIIKYCYEAHAKTNHFYDSYLPYKFHLDMVANAYIQFKHLLDDKEVCGTLVYDGADYDMTESKACFLACYGHDLIEDARQSYNDVYGVMGPQAADIVYAVTNDKGRNRKERAGEKYYEGIRQIEGAVFVKLCDRIANVQYGKLTKSRMFKTYKEENPTFIKALGYKDDHRFKEMFDYLNSLFENELIH